MLLKKIIISSMCILCCACTSTSVFNTDGRGNLIYKTICQSGGFDNLSSFADCEAKARQKCPNLQNVASARGFDKYGYYYEVLYICPMIEGE